MLEAGQSAAGFRRHGCHLITQSQICCEIGAYVHVILQIGAEDHLSNPSPGWQARRVSDQGQGIGRADLVVGEKVRKRTELEVSTRLGGRGLIVYDSLHVGAELQAVFPFGKKYGVVDLPRIPVILGRGLSTQPSREKRQAWYADKSYRVSGDVSETDVRRKRIDGLAARRSGGILAVVAQADGINQSWSEGMVLFHANQLPPGLREDKFVIKFIVLRRGRIVVHVAARQVIFLRKFMVNAGGEEVFGGDLGTPESENCGVSPACRTSGVRAYIRVGLGQRIKLEVRRHQRIYPHIGKGRAIGSFAQHSAAGGK